MVHILINIKSLKEELVFELFSKVVFRVFELRPASLSSDCDPAPEELDGRSCDQGGYRALNGLCHNNGLFPAIGHHQDILASRMAPTPMVMAKWGICSLGMPAFYKTLIVVVKGLFVRASTRVLEAREEPGSLKAQWPSQPIPRSCRSIPPDF